MATGNDERRGSKKQCIIHGVKFFVCFAIFPSNFYHKNNENLLNIYDFFIFVTCKTIIPKYL